MLVTSKQLCILDAAWMVADRHADPRIYYAVQTMIEHGYTDFAAKYIGRKYKQLVKGREVDGNES